jgi:hypothetical protein
MAESNRGSVLLPLFTMFGAGVVNMFVVGPRASKIKRERRRQGMLLETQRWQTETDLGNIETKDGKKSHDPPPHSEEMARLNKAFGKYHGISSALNLVGCLATVSYGIHLARRMQ